MKKFILYALFLLMVTSVLSQQVIPAPPMVKHDWLKKSNQQKNTAWYLLGGGFLSTGLGFFTLGGKSTSSVDNVALMGAGLGCMVASIPVFMSAAKKKKKAWTVQTGMDKKSILQPYNMVNDSGPSVSIMVQLK